MRWTLIVALLTLGRSAETKAPPAFFLQDQSDSLCLAGEEFKRCSIHTLFYVTGSPGKYQIHKRAVDGTTDEEDDGICIAKKSCKDGDVSKMAEAKLTKCSHCGAKDWNILGDADTGYVLSQSNGKTCLIREKGSMKAMTAPCDSPDVPFVPLQLQFASPSDIEAMSAPGARLIGAASDGDKKAIQEMLKEGTDISARDWDELTALIPAASAGHLDLCKFLVKEGIDVNAHDKDGITALMEASIMGHSKIVDFLVNSGADVDATAGSGVTALWLAASEGKVDVMKFLLSKDADATNTRVDGISALMTAAANGHADAVKLLLENGADPVAADKDGLTPLMNAAESGNVEIIKVLTATHKDPEYLDALSNTGFSALIIASAHGHAKVVEYLLDAGANVQAAADTKVTALMYAAASNHMGVVKLLVEKGKASIDYQHTNGGTALVEACTGGAVNAIRYLVEKGAVFDIRDDDGVTPLMAIASNGNLEGQQFIIEKLKTKLSEDEVKAHINLFSYSGGSAVMFAAAGGHTECTKQLMDLGADIKAIARATPEYLVKLEGMIADGQVSADEDPHVDGVTALHVAAQGGHLETVNLLLEAGVDVGVKDDEERTALSLSIKGNYGEVASALVTAGADPNTPYVDDEGESHNLLFDAVMVENDDFAKLLIEKGADIYHKDDKYVSTLLQASHRGLADVARMLVEKHGDKAGYINDSSEDGVTPLIAASSEGHGEIVKMLLAAKADVKLVDQDGTTALMAASARGHFSVVQDLLTAGSSINEQNMDGHTALMFAYNGKNQVETLWERYNQYVQENIKGDEAPDDSGTGPIIQEALGNHTALVELLLKSGADPKIKDKEGHTAKDFDYSPENDPTKDSESSATSSDEL